jgi:hypothetical protein
MPMIGNKVAFDVSGINTVLQNADKCHGSFDAWTCTVPGISSQLLSIMRIYFCPIYPFS